MPRGKCEHSEVARLLLRRLSFPVFFCFVFCFNVFPVVKEVEVGHIYFINGQRAFDWTKGVHSREQKLI